MNKVFLSLMVVLSMSPAFAVTGKSASVTSLFPVWGGGNWSSCGSHALGGSEACIGATASTCVAPTFDKNDKVTNADKLMYARNYTDEYALQMMVAVNVNQHGAYFCPIQVEAKNKNQGDAWTEYAQLSNPADCRWLCKDGYSGDNCSVAPGSGTTCNPAEFKRSNYGNLKRLASGANIENSIAMFSWNQYNDCGVSREQEHDGILAITRWAPGGHGAWVQPLIVRAQRQGWKDMISWPAVYYFTGATEQLVCVDGYKPNAGGTDCVAINEAICAEAKTCPGWTGFDEGLHTFVMPSGKDCFEFRCKGENQAFASITNRSCIECPTNSRGGMSSVDGTCVKCEAGKVFNNKATSTATHCGEAIAYTKSDMQYGKGKTKNSNPNVSQQCWTMTETDAYRECVTGIQKKPNVVKLPTTLTPKKVLPNGGATQLNLTKINMNNIN